MGLFNNELTPDLAVVMRAVWDQPGWLTIDDICDYIWQDNFPKHKVYKCLRELRDIYFVSIKKHKGRNYYAQRVSETDYYPFLCEDPEGYLKNEEIEISGLEIINEMKSVQKKLASLNKASQKKKR